MPRLIDADAFFNDFPEMRDYEYASQEYEVDAEPVRHGRWIRDRLVSTSGGTYGVYRCSVCEWYGQDIGYSFDYCPNCGAKMDGEREEDA